MKTFDVPGVGLAIVKDGNVVLAKGYGVRKLGAPEPVDGKTLFGIASNTKVFTAAALGLLVEDGKIQWDAPVVSYLPAFQMWDPWVTRELTVRDLLVHRAGLGLGAGDLLWWPPSTYNRAEIAHRLRFIKPATSFRSAYAYDNVLYLVAGQLIEVRERPEMGGVRHGAHPEEGRHDRLERAALRGVRGGQRGGHPCQRRRQGTADRAVPQRQHEPGRRHQLERRRHGEVDERAARGRQARQTARR